MASAFWILLSAKNGKVKRNLLLRWVGSTESPIRLAKTSTIDERDSLTPVGGEFVDL
jgi:hypothetical protein